jgi:hypothetical protein
MCPHQAIALEVRLQLAGFAAEMLGGLPRKDQRAAAGLYMRGLLADGQRKPMVPKAARPGSTTNG